MTLSSWRSPLMNVNEIGRPAFAIDLIRSGNVSCVGSRTSRLLMAMSSSPFRTMSATSDSSKISSTSTYSRPAP